MYFDTTEKVIDRRLSLNTWNYGICLATLGGVDKFEPVSGGGEVDHAEEAVGQLVVAGGNGAVDLQMPEHALDAVALLVGVTTRK